MRAAAGQLDVLWHTDGDSLGVDGAQELIGQYLFSRLTFIMRVYAEVVNLRACFVHKTKVTELFSYNKKDLIIFRRLDIQITG